MFCDSLTDWCIFYIITSLWQNEPFYSWKVCHGTSGCRNLLISSGNLCVSPVLTVFYRYILPVDSHCHFVLIWSAAAPCGLFQHRIGYKRSLCVILWTHGIMNTGKILAHWHVTDIRRITAVINRNQIISSTGNRHIQRHQCMGFASLVHTYYDCLSGCIYFSATWPGKSGNFLHHIQILALICCQCITDRLGILRHLILLYQLRQRLTRSLYLINSLCLWIVRRYFQVVSFIKVQYRRCHTKCVSLISRLCSRIKSCERCVFQDTLIAGLRYFISIWISVVFCRILKTICVFPTLKMSGETVGCISLPGAIFHAVPPACFSTVIIYI